MVLLFLNYKIEKQPIGLIHFIYLLIAMIGGMISSNILGSISGIGAYLIKFYLCFLFVILYIQNEYQLNYAVKIFIIAGLLNALMGWVELIGFYFFGEVIIPPLGESFFNTSKAYGFVDRGGVGALSIPGFMRMYGFMNEAANSFGTYMLVPFGLSIYLISTKKNILWYFLPIFFGLTIVASVSRNALIGMIVLLICNSIFKAVAKKNILKFLTKALISITIISTIGMILYILSSSNLYIDSSVQIDYNTRNSTPLFLFERLNPFVSKSIIKSFSYFSGHLKYALIHGFDNLGFGLGLQNFDDYVYKHYPLIVGYGAHSNFITFLGDTGIWGFLAQVFLQFIIIIMSFKTIINNPNDRLPAILLSTYLGLLITGIIRTYYLDTYTFIVMGMIYKICYLKTKQNKIKNNLIY